MTLGFCPDTGGHTTAISRDGGEIGISCDAISRDTCPDNATWLTRLTRVTMQPASNLGSGVTAEVQPTGVCTIVKGSTEKIGENFCVLSGVHPVQSAGLCSR